MWKASSILSILMTLIAKLTEADYYIEYGQDQYKRSTVPFKCSEEGYYPDPHNCRVYYRCVDWGNNSPLTIFRFKCGVGTVFSKDKGDICTHPEDSGRSECAISENEIDSNLHNPPENPSTTWTTIKTTLRPQPTSTQTITTRPPITTNKPITTTKIWKTTIQPLLTTNRPNIGQSEHNVNCKNKTECTQEGFLENLCDCRKFYRCVEEGYGNFRKYDFTCGVGTVWDPEIQGCNHAWAVTRINCKKDLENGGDSGDNTEQWNGGNNGQWDGVIGDNDGQWNGDTANNVGQWDTDSSSQHGQHGQTEQPSSSGTLCYLGSFGISASSDYLAILDMPINPDSPDFPETSDFPNIANSAGTPGYPAIPDTSVSSESSGYPEILDSSSMSNSVENPSTPDFPDSSGKPGSPGIQSFPQTQSSPGYPGSLGTSDSSGFPCYTETPNAQGIIGSPESSNTPSSSEPTGYPGSSEYPSSPDISSSPSSHGSEPWTGTCTEEGFFADPKNCRKFYRCVGDGMSFTKYEFQCSIGTAWDSSIQSCNYDYAVQHCNKLNDVNETDTSQNEVSNTSGLDSNILPPVQSPESSTILLTSIRPEIQSSTQVMSTISRPISPSHTTSVSSSPSASSTYPLSTTRTTESVSYLPPTTQMITSVSYLPPLSTTQPGSSMPTTSRSTASISSSPASSTVSSPQGGKSECTEEGFFPNPDDCRKFYRCVQVQSDYQKYEFQCGPGTAWDQFIHTCNHIDQVTSCSTDDNEIDQDLKPSTSSLTTTISSQTRTTTFTSAIPTSSTESTTVGTPNKISTELSTLGIDKTESSMTTVTTFTDSGMEKPVSGKPEEIQMPGSSSTEGLSESSSENSTPESSEESSSSMETHVSDCTTRKPNNTIVCNNEGFYPHQIRCDKFYRCVDNGNGFNVYHFDCPPSTIFDPSINVCNYPESVYPARDCITTPATTQSEAPEKSTSTEITITQSTIAQQAEENVTTSTELVTTVSTIETTASEGSTTAFGTESTTSEIPGSENITESSTIIMVDATDSSTSEQIIEVTTENLPTTSMVSTGSEISTIESQEQSTMKLQEQSTTESQKQSTTEYEEQSTTESQEQPVTMTPCPIANLTDDQITLICPTGFRRHPKYCNLFYQCISEGNMEIKILVLSCPENTVFDESKIQCLSASSSNQHCTKASARFYRRLEDNALTPMKVSSDRLCSGEGHFPYRQGCSHTFYKCKRDIRNNLQGYFYKCPENFIYWSVSRRCESITNLPMCSRLAYKNKTVWNDRWQIPTEDFNLSARMLRSS